MTQSTSAIETLLEIMRRRQNIRTFKPDPVPDEYVSQIIEAARLAPSGANSQPWEFIVIRDPARKQEVAEVFAQAFKKGLEADPRFPAGKEAALRKKFTDAPVLIAVCADPRLEEAYPAHGFREAILYVSMGAAMEHMHLAAVALGLAMCWGTVNKFTQEGLGKLLGVPSPLIVKEVFSLGFPAVDWHPKHRRSVAEVTHYERLDAGKLRTDAGIAEALATRRVPDIYSGRQTDAS